MQINRPIPIYLLRNRTRSTNNQ